jgi:hypothetical protein
VAPPAWPRPYVAAGVRCYAPFASSCATSAPPTPAHSITTFSTPLWALHRHPRRLARAGPFGISAALARSTHPRNSPTLRPPRHPGTTTSATLPTSHRPTTNANDRRPSHLRGPPTSATGRPTTTVTTNVAALIDAPRPHVSGGPHRLGLPRPTANPLSRLPIPATFASCVVASRAASARAPGLDGRRLRPPLACACDLRFSRLRALLCTLPFLPLYTPHGAFALAAIAIR